MDGPRREVVAILLGADIGRELDGITAPCELLRQRRGGKEMPPVPPAASRIGFVLMPPAP